MAAGFVLAATLTAVVVPWERHADPLLIVGLVLLYAAISRIDFEIGSGYANPEQLAFVPLLFLAPLPLVPLLAAAGFALGRIRKRLGPRSRAHAVSELAGAWFALGPVWVLAALAPGAAPTLDHIGIYALALLAQVTTSTAAASFQEQLARDPQPVWPKLWAWRVDAVLSPIALVVAIQAASKPIAVAAVLPLAWLLHVFSQERKERYSASLELQSAYRGTVMLLSDVVEADDDYTATHSRSVVELVAAVADEMGIPTRARQELEFAALLHDVGKIAIPKEILNKPAKLTDEEFELIKTHTIEGQLLLDRVGGLLARVGKIVRSCHERWDGRGYPDGLSGEAIPLPARIVFCCDAYNAMTTDRPYRKAMPRVDALAEIRTNAGTQFDPAVAEALERVILAQEDFPHLVEGVRASDAVAATLTEGRGAKEPQPERAAAAG